MKTELLKILGMSCGGCTSKVSQALEALTGVNEVKVSLSDGEATVQYDESITSPERLKVVVKEAGYSVEPIDVQQDKNLKGCCCS